MRTTNECSDIVIQCDGGCGRHVDFSDRASYMHVRNVMQSWHNWLIAEVDGPAYCPDCQEKLPWEDVVRWRVSFDGGNPSPLGWSGDDIYLDARTPEEALALGCEKARTEHRSTELIAGGVVVSRGIGCWRRFKDGKFEKPFSTAEW